MTKRTKYADEQNCKQTLKKQTSSGFNLVEAGYEKANKYNFMTIS